MDLKEKQRLRLAFLNKLYEMTENNRIKQIFGGDVAEQIGLKDMDVAYGIVQYLAGESLVEEGYIDSPPPHYLRITHYGIKQVESANLYPDQPTDHFLPVNVLFVENMIGSSIQQGTTNSNQTFTKSVDSLAGIEEFFEQVSMSIDQLNLNNETAQELNSEIETIKSQLKSPKPKTTIIREVLESTRTILESAAGGALGVQLAQQIPALLAKLV